MWEPTPRGWRVVRARIPGRPRNGQPSERVPRPPEHPAHAAGVEGYSPRELREGARGLFDPNNLRRLLVELEDLTEAAARALLVPVELLALALRKKGRK